MLVEKGNIELILQDWIYLKTQYGLPLMYVLSSFAFDPSESIQSALTHQRVTEMALVPRPPALVDMIMTNIESEELKSSTSLSLLLGGVVPSSLRLGYVREESRYMKIQQSLRACASCLQA